MIRVEISVRAKDGTDKPAPATHIQADEWSPDVVEELFAVLCERAGAIGGVGLLPARIDHLDGGRVQLNVSTVLAVASSEPIAIPDAVLAASPFKIGSTFGLEVRPYRFSAVDILDLHFPVFAGRRVADDLFKPAAPVIYGTAFPIWHGGILATAAHVVKTAAAEGEIAIGRLGSSGPAIPAYGIEEVETFEDFDFALIKCPALERFPPITLEMRASLRMFDECKAVGYPFSVDPEHFVAVHRGFAGHVVACRQLYRLAEHQLNDADVDAVREQPAGAFVPQVVPSQVDALHLLSVPFRSLLSRFGLDAVAQELQRLPARLKRRLVKG